MNIFDIIGPVMVGPSSSHTAGAVRIGKIARLLLGEQPVKAIIHFHGSFARTYKGHGTDKAIMGGLLGMSPDDLRIKDSLQIAKNQGVEYTFETVEIEDAHPNTAFIEAFAPSGKKISLLGSSVGGGNIVVKKINGLDVEFTGQYHTLIVPHKDAPGAVSNVTKLLAQNTINIANMKVYRSQKGGEAIMVIETDQEINKEISTLIGQLDGIKNATIIQPM